MSTSTFALILLSIRYFGLIQLTASDQSALLQCVLHHRRWWKQEVGRRLALGALAVAYNTSTCHQGPFPDSAVSTKAGAVTVTFKQQAGCGTEGITLRRRQDFELKPAGGANWTLASISASDSRSVTLVPKTGDAIGGITAVRYLWSTSPGSHDKNDLAIGNVSIYGKGELAEGLPAPPFFMAVSAE